MSEETQKENEKIQELLTKLKIVKESLIEEKKKSEDYLKKIRELETVLQKKDSQIEEINKEKAKIEVLINNEKLKTTKSISFNGMYDRIFHKEKYSKEKLEKLKEETVAIQKANLDLSHKIGEEKELIDQSKIKFQTQMTVKTNKLQELKCKLNMTNEDSIKFNELRKEIENKRKQYEEEKRKEDIKLDKVKEETGTAIQLLNDVEKRKAESEEANKKATDELKMLEEKMKNLANNLIQSKQKQMDEAIEKTSKKFKIQKLGGFGKQYYYVYFEQNPNNEKVLQLILKGEKEKESDKINIVTLSCKATGKDKVEMEYRSEKGNKEIKKVQFRFHEMCIPVFMDIYRDWSQRAEKLNF